MNKSNTVQPKKKVSKKSVPSKERAVRARAPVKAKAPKSAPVTRTRVKKAASLRRISDGERQRMIAEAAYYRAENRGFGGGNPVEDWLAAEAEINALLGSAATGKA